jgi:Uma2 family endonuclease
MSTFTSVSPAILPVDPASFPPPVPAYGDHCIVFRDMAWDIYDALSDAAREGEHVRLAYDGKDLEIMTTGNVHENLKVRVGRFVDAVVLWSKISVASCGETTWKSANAKRGLQADLSYCFDPEKVRAAREALARGSMDPADYPWPDLAVEIDISPSQIDRPSIYAALRVAEVWRVDRDRKPVIEHLQADGSYAPADASRFLPVSADEIHGWLTAEDVGEEDAWYRRLNQWAMGLTRQD